MCSIYENGDFEYPLKQSHLLRLVKTGDVPFLEVKQVLEQTLERVEELAKISPLKNKVSVNKWNDWLLTKYHEMYFQFSN